MCNEPAASGATCQRLTLTGKQFTRVFGAGKKAGALWADVGHGAGWAANTSARGTGSRRLANGCRDRQPKRQNNRKRGPRGYDGNKKVKGRKRFAASDTQGNLLESVVVPANSGERAGAWLLLEKLKTSVLGQNLKLIRADEGFAGVDWERQVQEHFGWRVEIVRKPPGQVGFALLPRRWVIEQTFGCWGRNRRLSRDYEQNPNCSRATLQIAALHRTLRRLKPAPNHDPPFRYRNP